MTGLLFAQFFQVFLGGSGLLPGVNAFGALFLEEDLEGHKDQLQIQPEGIALDIGQIQLQLVVGGGVVLAVDLGIAGQAGLDLQTEVKLRNDLTVVLRQMGTFRPGADDGHIPLENVEKLGQLVKMDVSKHLAHGSDAVIILAGHDVFAVLLLDPHTAEFDDLEDFAVPGQALLGEEHGAAVIELDQQSDDQHEGGRENDAQNGHHNVKCPLQGPLADGNAVVAEEQQGGVEQVDGGGVHDHHIGDLGNRVAPHIMLKAKFQQHIPLMGGNIRQHHAAAGEHFFLDDGNVGIVTDGFLDQIFVGPGGQLCHQIIRAVLAVDHQKVPGRGQLQVQPTAKQGPDGQKQDVQQGHHQDGGQMLAEFPAADQA